MWTVEITTRDGVVKPLTWPPPPNTCPVPTPTPCDVTAELLTENNSTPERNDTLWCHVAVPNAQSNRYYPTAHRGLSSVSITAWGCRRSFNDGNGCNDGSDAVEKQQEAPHTELKQWNKWAFTKLDGGEAWILSACLSACLQNRMNVSRFLVTLFIWHGRTSGILVWTDPTLTYQNTHNHFY